MGKRVVQSIILSRTAERKRTPVSLVVNQQYRDRISCGFGKSRTKFAHIVTEKALDDIDQGIGLSKIYKDTDEMFRDLGV